MKTYFIVTIYLLSANLLCAQHKNLDKLPPKERDSILVKIANEEINKRSEGYLQDRNKPYIEDIGFEVKNFEEAKKFIKENRYVYAVSYLPSEKDKNFYKKNYLVKAFILADIGKVTLIRYIDDYEYVISELEDDTPNERIYKRRFKPAEERLEEIYRFRHPKKFYFPDTATTEEDRKYPRIIIYPDSMRIISKKLKEYIEMDKRRQDSAIILRQRYLIRRDSIRREDSIRRIQEKYSQP